jgi:hypothetical protein
VTPAAAVITASVEATAVTAILVSELASVTPVKYHKEHQVLNKKEVQDVF